MQLLWALAAALAPAAPAQVNAAGVTFDQAAAHCFRLADRYSSDVASSANDYDGDSVGGAIGAALSVGIERKGIRKRLYMKCMEANGFHKARYVKLKPRAQAALQIARRRCRGFTAPA